MLSTLASRAGPSKALSHLRSLVLVRQSSSLPKKSEAQEPASYPYQDTFLGGPQKELTIDERLKYWKEANEIFYGPQRDMKNFPPLELPEKLEKDYNLVVIPSSWFKPIYERLGVSGCYSLFWGSVLFGLNKEFLIMPSGDFADMVLAFGVFSFLTIRYGPRLASVFDRYRKEVREFHYEQPLQEAKEGYIAELDELKTNITNQEAVPVIYEAKKEQVDLQLEVQYRERLADIFEQVTRRLDYQAAVEEAKRKFEEDLMVNWIVDGVEKALTPQHEKESIGLCIKTLQNLSKTASL